MCRVRVARTIVWCHEDKFLSGGWTRFCLLSRDAEIVRVGAPKLFLCFPVIGLHKNPGQNDLQLMNEYVTGTDFQNCDVTPRAAGSSPGNASNGSMNARAKQQTRSKEKERGL